MLQLLQLQQKQKISLLKLLELTKKMLKICYLLLQQFYKVQDFLWTVKISGAKNSSPKLQIKKIMNVNPSLVNQTLGLNLTASKIVSSLKKSRLDASTVKGKNIVCTIPAYRFDIFGPMDLVEEVALGYGIQNLEPTLTPSQTLGQTNPTSLQLKSLNQTMTGLGYLEALNSSLTSKRVLYDNGKQRTQKIISVLIQKVKNIQFYVILLLPGLLENLSKNIHESYPQKLFETGTVFSAKIQFLRQSIYLN